MTDDDTQEVDPQLRIGVDSWGDPIVMMRLELPPGYGFTPAEAEQLALKILAAAAASRLRAGVVRKRMMENGEAMDEAMKFVDRNIPMG